MSILRDATKAQILIQGEEVQDLKTLSSD